MDDEWQEALPTRPLQPDSPFSGTDATVQDFWRFAMSDLRTNNVRGYLAEFLVARAVGASGPRVEWDAYDVLSPDGTRIEVKSSAYLQVWAQRRPSRIVFSGLRGRTWTPRDGYSERADYNADVYVFAVQTATTHEAYDPLDVGQWDFYVMGRDAVAATGRASLSLSTVQGLAGGATPWTGLARAVQEASSG